MADSRIRIEVVYALPERYWSLPLDLPRDATAADALAVADLARLTGIPGLDWAGLAIFGRAITAATVLRDGDRLEVLRALHADPKQARRQRAASPSGRD